MRATSALRVLQSMLGHLRLDVDAETVADAEFDASTSSTDRFPVAAHPIA